MIDLANAVLLDTCAAIYLVEGVQMTAIALDRIEQAAGRESVLVSVVSAWEIGGLARLRPGRPPKKEFLPDAETWFAKFIARPGLTLAPCDPLTGIAASFLPEPFHNDPADRLIVAAARRLNVPIVTRDAKIIAYAKAGHCAAIEC
jgi:PIN domain nuclease of toxin-antitoxin system